jgi:hypothetical protein
MEGLVAYNKDFYWELFELISGREYGKAHSLLACSNASMEYPFDDPERWWHCESPFQRLCASDDGVDDVTRNALIRFCLTRGADACVMVKDFSAAYYAAKHTQLDTLRVVFLECGAPMRGETAVWLLRAVRSRRRRVETGDISWIYEAAYWHSPEYIGDLRTAERIIRQARARQNWKAARARTVGRIALFVKSLFDEVRFRPGGSGFESARSEFEALASGRPAASQKGAETMEGLGDEEAAREAGWEEAMEGLTSGDEEAAREAEEEEAENDILCAAVDLAEAVHDGRLKLLHDDDPALKVHWEDPPRQTEVLVGDAGNLPLKSLGFSAGALPFRDRPLSATQLRGIEKRRAVAAARKAGLVGHSASVLVLCGDKALLTKEKRGGKVAFGLLGGKCEAGETLPEAAAREAVVKGGGSLPSGIEDKILSIQDWSSATIKNTTLRLGILAVDECEIGEFKKPTCTRAEQLGLEWVPVSSLLQLEWRKETMHYHSSILVHRSRLHSFRLRNLVPAAVVL